MERKFASASCPNCETLFERLPVEYDEDGGYAFLEVHPCADPVCGKLLCACCDQFHCDDMERPTEQSASDLAGNFARHRSAEELYESTTCPLEGPICQNCGLTVDRVTLVPGFEYMGCDDCMVEALTALARKQAQPKPARIARMQSEIFPEVA